MTTVNKCVKIKEKQTFILNHCDSNKEGTIMQNTYIMSDIHGHYTEFIKMLEKIKFDESDTLYIIGDIIDRGRENLKILEYIINAKNIHLLMGNHEDMLLHTYRGNNFDKEYYMTMWLYNGGYTTQKEFENLSKKQKEKYLDFLEELPTYQFIYVNNKEYLLVHAGVMFYEEKYTDRYTLMKDQKDNVLWVRDDFLNSKINTPFKIIFGHTPTKNITQYVSDLSIEQKNNGLNNQIIKWNNKIAIDCGLAADSKLGCLRLNDMEEFYVNTENLN